MVIAVTGYALKNGFKGGGDGLKIGCYRAKGVKKAKNQVKKFNRTTRKYDGPLVREASCLYLFDYYVTGSSMDGTDNSKFSLWYLFEYEVFSAMEKLVAEEGEYGGYKPIFRGDNDGPHRDKKEEGLEIFCEACCKARRWGWEPQSEN